MPREGSLLAQRKLSAKKKTKRKLPKEVVLAPASSEPEPEEVPVKKAKTNKQTTNKLLNTKQHAKETTGEEAEESLSRGAQAWRAAKAARETKLAGGGEEQNEEKNEEPNPKRDRLAGAQADGRRLFVGGISTKECDEAEADRF